MSAGFSNTPESSVMILFINLFRLLQAQSCTARGIKNLFMIRLKYRKALNFKYDHSNLT